MDVSFLAEELSLFGILVTVVPYLPLRASKIPSSISDFSASWIVFMLTDNFSDNSACAGNLSPILRFVVM